MLNNVDTVTKKETRGSYVFKMVECKIEIEPLMLVNQSEYINLFYHRANLDMPKTYSLI